MELSKIETKVRGIISEQLGIDENSVKLTSNLVEDLGADSLDAVELLIAAEDEFGIEISDATAVEWKTVDDVVKYLTANVQ